MYMLFDLITYSVFYVFGSSFNTIFIFYFFFLLVEMSVVQALYPPCSCGMMQIAKCGHSATEKLGFTRLCGIEAIGLSRNRKSLLKPILAKEDNGASRIEDGHQAKKPNGLTPLANHSAALFGTIKISSLVFLMLYLFVKLFLLFSVVCQCIVRLRF